jgi:hypothetical protein
MFTTKEIMNKPKPTRSLSERRQYSRDEAKRIGDVLGIPWNRFGVDQFRIGLNLELERGRREPQTALDRGHPVVAGVIVLARLNEMPDYYVRLSTMENKAEPRISRPRTKRL